MKMNIMNIHKLTFKIVQNERDYTFLAGLLVQIIEKQTLILAHSAFAKSSVGGRCTFVQFRTKTFLSIGKNRKVSPFFCYSLTLDGNLVASCLQEGISHKNWNN